MGSFRVTIDAEGDRHVNKEVRVNGDTYGEFLYNLVGANRRFLGEIRKTHSRVRAYPRPRANDVSRIRRSFED